MPLAPGPFVLQSPANVAVELQTFNYTGLVEESWSEIDVLTLGMDALFTVLEVVANAPADPVPDISLDDMLSVAVALGTNDFAPEYDDMVGAVVDGGAQLSAAVSSAPPQAFLPPTLPYNPVIPGLVFAPPTIPPGAFVPGNLPTGTPQPTSPTGPTTNWPRQLSLINLSVFGAANFSVGQDFQVTATGAPGEAVIVSGTFNGQTFAPVTEGTIDAAGNFVLNGSMPPENVGNWHEVWTIGGQVVATFDFLVSP